MDLYEKMHQNCQEKPKETPEEKAEVQKARGKYNYIYICIYMRGFMH